MNKDGLVMELKRKKGWLKSHGRQAVDAAAYRGWLPRRVTAERITGFWERQAEEIHERWGRGDWDYTLLASIIQRYRAASVLDIGCGSGRLFELYRREGISNVLGIDISADALAIAAREHPGVPTRLGPLEDTLLPTDRFDLLVSNRVLQHIPARHIADVIRRLCAIGRVMYLNELSDSDHMPEEFFMARHPYESLFAAYGWRVAERGSMGDQTYLLLQAG